MLLNPDINFSLKSKRHNPKFAHVKSNMEQFVRSLMFPFTNLNPFKESLRQEQLTLVPDG